MASIEPDKPAIIVRTHGPSGYRQGCRCAVCVDGERARHGRGAPQRPVPEPGSKKGPVGTLLRQTRKLIRSMDLPGTPAVELIKSQAVEGARALDAALAAGRPLSAALRMHGEAVKALKASEVPPPQPEPEDPVGPVADADDMDLWLAAIHWPSVTCQPGFPAVRPGTCDRCDAAPMARAMYGRRHPERPGHEFGMSREECACARCAAELAIVRESMGKI